VRISLAEDNQTQVVLFFSFSESMTPRRETSTSKQFFFRFDVWLSLNDKVGNKIDRRKFLELEFELYEKFKGLTRTPIIGVPIYEGFWENPETGSPARDANTIYTVLTPDTPASYDYFVPKKPRWEARFGQKKILITVHQLEIL
jgi:hypothetical protein